MRTNTTILVQKKKDSAHREVKVTIDWSGVSRTDLEILARNALLYDLHCQIRRSDDPVPESVLINVRDKVHHEPVMLTQYKPVPRNSKRVKDLAELLAELSEEERQLLLE